MAFDLRIFGADVKSKAVIISAQDRTNVYFDVSKEPDRAPVAAYGTPGTIHFCTPSGFTTRAMYFMPALSGILVLQGRMLFLVSDYGIPRKIVTLPNESDIQGEASITDNGTQVLIITRDHGYIIDTKNNYLITDITSQLPQGGSNSCAFLDGYFIVNRRNTQQFFISQLYDGLTWNALDFASAETSPDNLKAVVANNGYLYLLGELTTEIWVNNGGALFPFDKIQGATITYGLISIDSLAVINTSIVALVRDRYGMLAIGTIEGGRFTELSTPDISYIINKYATVDSADGFVYALNGRYFYQITFNNNATWLYDFTSGAWSRIESWKLAFSKYRYGVAFNRKFIVSNYSNGRLAYFDADTYTEEGAQLVREIQFNHVFAPTQNYSLISRFRAWIDTGQGLAIAGASTPGSAIQVTASLLYHFDSYPFTEETGALINQDPNTPSQFVTTGQTFGAGAFMASHGAGHPVLGGGIFVTYLTEDPDHTMQPNFTIRFRYTPTISTAGGLTIVLDVNAAINMYNITNTGFRVFRGFPVVTGLTLNVGQKYAISVEAYNNNGYLYIDGALVHTFVDLQTNCYAFYSYNNPLIFNLGPTTNDVAEAPIFDEFAFFNGVALSASFGVDTYTVETQPFNLSFYVSGGSVVETNVEPQGENPTLYLQISRNKGNTFGERLPTEIGRRGEFYRRAEWRRLGQARDWVFRLRMTDPVKFVLTDVSLAIGEANS